MQVLPVLLEQKSRRYALTLYKQCLQCVERIPDDDHRQMYRHYVRDRFRQHQKLGSSSRQAYVAIRDAEDQLDRMNYFHSIREQRQMQQQIQQQLQPLEQVVASSLNDAAWNQVQPTKVALPESYSSSPPPPQQRSIDSSYSLSSNERRSHEHDNNNNVFIDHEEAATTTPTTTFATSEELLLVQNWLLKHLPQLLPNDLEYYAQELVQLGFDSQDMLSHVEVTEDDLRFMKPAHRRALLERRQNERK